MNFFIKTSSNLYLFWNFGFILSIAMLMQIMIGFILSTSYFFHSMNLFNNSFFIFYNLNYGWMMRFMHSNLTSMIFITLLIHMTRSMMYKNYINNKMWNSGMMILLLLMMVSFLGYSLIWSQMAYWASMVITNFIATIPIIGTKFMLLIWGNQFINNILMNRFFSIHFLFALLIMILLFIHLTFLHINKSTNPMNLNNNIDQINLNPMFILKDLTLLMIFLYILFMTNMLIPSKMNNPDNFNQMLMFKTPTHIEPEWYFLFFYSILRTINNKFTGLMIMILSIMIWFLIPNMNKTKFISNKFNLINKLILLMMILTMCLISFIGSKPSKFPFTLIMKFMIMIYFKLFLIMLTTSNLINKN